MREVIAKHKMKTFRSTLRTMWLVILLFQLGLILRTEAQLPDPCILSDTNRPPENSDIIVTCGTQYMYLSIYICPMYQALYNESMMALNNEFNKLECFGTADWTAVPPVLKFKIPLNESAITACNSNFKVTNEVGSGAFVDFSNVQYINISGEVNSRDPSTSKITYRSQILYKFSCRYPMQYLLNNTQVAVSGVNLAIQGNNGSFISTLNMQLYKDEGYKDRLEIPQTGINLKTKVYVSVKAENLTDRFHVLLDRCYATTSPIPLTSTFYDLFIGCTLNPQIKVELNGVSQMANFSFEAFRFVDHKEQIVSTYYVHCVTRLCETTSCSTLLPNCTTQGRRKRETHEVLPNATVSSPAILVSQQTRDSPTFFSTHELAYESNYSSPVVAVIICICILTILLISMVVYFMFYIRQKKSMLQ
ncbi:zona pellucida-like domain-containing protein 1 isoform X2 [Scophthalmus maximus]|uniref:zona pellucida-like domain-containing protein 1 isoform X2 n=1 Tax=Scophthalmus maximus TaxID=52904 RepID=UPI0015E0B522|nr:zona pellucida-like domain-containing protein 1 isoform X2 [Scophthalmus maximus]